MQAFAHHGGGPPPPRPPPPEAIPLEMRFNRPMVEVMDASENTLSPPEMAAKCTEYVVYRFEKSGSNNNPLLERDEEDATKSSWEHAIRTMVQGQTQRELAKEVRRLDSETAHVMQKKQDLSPALQRQLDRTIFYLASTEHDPANYQWTLAQVDQKLRQVGQVVDIFHTRHPLTTRPHKSEGKKSHKCKRKDKSRSRNKGDKRRMKSLSKARHASYPLGKKKYWERESVTAYFKRAPRPDVNVVALYHNRKELQQMTRAGAFNHQQDLRAGGQGQGVPFTVLPPRPPPGPHPGPPQGPHPRPPQGHHPGQRPAGLPPGAHPNRIPPPPAMGNPGGGGKPPVKADHPPGKKKPQVYVESQSSSGYDSASTSDSDSGSGSAWSDDESTLTGPTQSTSTTGSSYRVGRHERHDRHDRHDKRGRSHHRGHSHSKNRNKSRDRSRGKGRAINRSRSRKRRASRHRRRSSHCENRSAFGISPHSPRVHQRYDHVYTFDSDPVFPPHHNAFDIPPPTPIIVQQQPPPPRQRIEIEKIKDEAYLEGRADEKKKTQALDEMSSDYRPPRVSSRTRHGHGVRHVVRTVERPERHRETRRETFHVPRRPPYPVDVDMDTVDSYSSSEDEFIEYEPVYSHTDHRSRIRRRDADFHHSRRSHPRSPPRRSAYVGGNVYETHRRADGHRRRSPCPDTYRVVDPVDPLYRHHECTTSDYMQDRGDPLRFPQTNPFEPRLEPRFRRHR